MPTRYVTPYAREFADDGLEVGAGYKLNFYAAGTTTRQDTYSDIEYATANENPVVADSDGRFPDIWMVGSYKVILTDADGVQIWSADNVSGSGGAGDAGVFATAQDLRDFGYASWATSAKTLGAATDNDNGGGSWRWDADSTDDDNLGTVLLPTGHTGAGRWRRVLGQYLSPVMFGAFPDATWTGTEWAGTDQTAAIQAAEDACEAENLDMLWTGGKYFVAGTIIKRAGVDWVGSYAAGSATKIGPILCPSWAVSSVQDAVTGAWSNPVICYDYENSSTYFLSCALRGINIWGVDSSVATSIDSARCPRVAHGAFLVSSIHLDGGRVRGMRSAVAGVGLIDSIFDLHISMCGDDTSGAPVYTYHMTTDKRVTDGLPGFGEGETEIRGNNHNTYRGRIENCVNWFYIESYNGSGDHKFQGMKIEDSHFFWPDGLARNTYAAHIKPRCGSVFFDAGCNFRTIEDDGSEWLIYVQNDGTHFGDCAFHGAGRWVLSNGNAMTMGNIFLDNARADTHIFGFSDGVVVGSITVEQKVGSATKRDFANIIGSDVRIGHVLFLDDGTPGTMADGPLFSVDETVSNFFCTYTIDEASNYKGATSTATGEAPKGFCLIKFRGLRHRPRRSSTRISGQDSRYRRT